MKIPFFSSKTEEKQVLGIDIGGSGIKGAVVDVVSGEILTERLRLETPQPATPQAVIDTIKTLVSDLKWTGAIGCGFPAVIQQGVAKTAANVDASWIGTNIEQLITEQIKCHARVINDADAAGLAEVKFGAGQGVEGVVLMLTIGTGIGSALFIDGLLVPNTEYGHLYYKDIVAEKYCSDAARKKYELEWDVWSDRFNKYLRHLERTVNPDLFIIGGGISKKPEKFLPFLTIDTPLKIAEQQNNAGIVGAAMAAA
ncbi:MAG: polyphosphate--glucose phosphotransferase [Cytophagales bacterium]